MRRMIVMAALLLPLWAMAQEKGIKFTEFKNWNEVLKEAQKTKRNIFVDAYATWCVPCKKMDAEVYINAKIANYVNSNFIAVKIQFDRPESDAQTVKNWYGLAKEMQQKFQITVFPTFLFISSSDQLIYKGVGYQDIDKFLAMLERANDPKQNFAAQITQFNERSLPMAQLRRLAITAKEYQQDSLALQIAKVYKANVIDRSSPEEILTPEFLEFISNFYDIFLDTDPVVKYMYEFPSKADLAMKAKYADAFVDYLIYRNYINSEIVTEGKYISGNPPWNSIEKYVSKRFDKRTAHRLIVSSKFAFYNYHQDWDNAIRYAIEEIEIKGIDTSLMGAVNLNNLAYGLIFKHTNDLQYLKMGIKFMEELLKTNNHDYIRIDTYANLLYKAGFKEKAICEQERALKLATAKKDEDRISELAENLTLMKSNRPTWPTQ